MKITALLALTLGIAAPIYAQTPISAPPGWTMQSRAQGANVYTPGDLQTGEVYSITVYDSAALEGKTLAEFLTAFGGTVGKKPGNLTEPLKVTARDGRFVTAVGVYGGPNNSALGALFVGVTVDGAQNIHMMRTLFSGQPVLDRYKDANDAFMALMTKRATREAGNNILVVPNAVTAKITPGGELVPGVYAGNQYSDGELRYRFRLYLYANGEYRFTDQNDADYKERFGDEKTGKWSYNRNSGQLDVDRFMDMANDDDGNYCYYGRDAQGKATIIALESGITDKRTELVYDGQPTKRPSPATMEARKAAALAEKNRFKWVTPPGKGVTDAQIATMLSYYDLQVYSAGMSGLGTNVTDEAYLLLKDGTVYSGLRVAPDQLDIVRSRQNEPDKWGKWTKKGTGFQVSWNGKPYVDLRGDKASPAPAQTKLVGRYGTASSSANLMGGSYSFWGVTFDQNGRFKKDNRGGSSYGVNTPGLASVITQYDDEGSFVGANGNNMNGPTNFTLSSETKKKNPNGAREGDYSLSGYVLTLRYDNGDVTRLPFFFGDSARKVIWFEGNRMTLDEKKK